jgi:hypothetical protein
MIRRQLFSGLFVLLGLSATAKGQPKKVCPAPGCINPEIKDGDFVTGYVVNGEIVPAHFKCGLKASMRVPKFSKR